MATLAVEEKRARLAELLRQKRDDRRIAPVSFAQQRLWFLDQYHPNSSAYNIFRALRIRGPLSVEALARSLNDLVERQAALRTTFRQVADGEPMQVVAASLTIPLVRHDLHHLDPAAREA